MLLLPRCRHFRGGVATLMAMTTGTLAYVVTPEAHAQVRVASYNCAGLDGNLSAMGDVLEAMMVDDKPGFSVAPHVIVFQEVATGDVASLLSMLNAGAPAGVAYLTATFTSFGENNAAGAQACFYRGDVLLEVIGAHDDIFTGAGRYADRWKFELSGYGNLEAAFYIYSMHLKASQGEANEITRLNGVNAVRANADALPPDSHVVYCGDMNFYSNNEPGYGAFLAAGNAAAFDPLGTGSWAGGGQAIKHTQSPLGTGNGELVGGGMDDRFDFILPGDEFGDGAGLALMAGTYRPFGNDGNHFDQSINSGNNFYYPADLPRSNALADDLHDASDHIPLIAEFMMPALLDIDLPDVLDRVVQSSLVLVDLTVNNGAPTTVASGAYDLNWSALGTGDVIGTAFGSRPPLSAPETATFFLNTAAVGPLSGSVIATAIGEGTGNSLVTLPVAADVVRASAPSFESGQETTETEIDWALSTDSGVQTIDVDIFNAGFDSDQALLDLDGVQTLLGAATFSGGLQTDIGAAPATLQFAFDTDGAAPGTHSAEFVIDTSDEDIPGAGQSALSITLSIEIDGGGSIPGDVDGDGDVDFSDLVALLAAWGPCIDCPADFDDDGDVDFTDLVTLLSNWG